MIIWLLKIEIDIFIKSDSIIVMYRLYRVKPRRRNRKNVQEGDLGKLQKSYNIFSPKIRIKFY